mmetsp:Transcript_80779/g.234299  ORF Transcript_80779/g.234299 Transcript_80779/m.234299 type:complete len:239 (-) Transcript_80779:2384-3100(-)
MPNMSRLILTSLHDSPGIEPPRMPVPAMIKVRARGLTRSSLTLRLLPLIRHKVSTMHSAPPICHTRSNCARRLRRRVATKAKGRMSTRTSGSRNIARAMANNCISPGAKTSTFFVVSSSSTCAKLWATMGAVPAEAKVSSTLQFFGSSAGMAGIITVHTWCGARTIPAVGCKMRATTAMKDIRWGSVPPRTFTRWPKGMVRFKGVSIGPMGPSPDGRFGGNANSTSRSSMASSGASST